MGAFCSEGSSVFLEGCDKWRRHFIAEAIWRSSANSSYSPEFVNDYSKVQQLISPLDLEVHTLLASTTGPPIHPRSLPTPTRPLANLPTHSPLPQTHCCHALQTIAVDLACYARNVSLQMRCYIATCETICLSFFANCHDWIRTVWILLETERNTSRNTCQTFQTSFFIPQLSGTLCEYLEGTVWPCMLR